MSESKSKLKLQLPTHHVYDVEDGSMNHFEAPLVGKANANMKPMVPVRRRKISKSLCVSNDVDITKFMAIPDTPPTPSGTTSLYPFLRLHRQISTSVSQVNHTSDRNTVFSKADTSGQMKTSISGNSRKTSLGQLAVNKLKPVQNSGQRLSEAVIQHGLTAVVKSEPATGTGTSVAGGSSGNIAGTSIQPCPAEPLQATREMELSRSMEKRRSSGFLSSLLLGHELADGKPLNVSAFDMTMCAPGPT